MPWIFNFRKELGKKMRKSGGNWKLPPPYLRGLLGCCFVFATKTENYSFVNCRFA
jgi:hypothetical protein